MTLNTKKPKLLALIEKEMLETEILLNKGKFDKIEKKLRSIHIELEMFKKDLSSIDKYEIESLQQKVLGFIESMTQKRKNHPELQAEGQLIVKRAQQILGSRQ